MEVVVFIITFFKKQTGEEHETKKQIYACAEGEVIPIEKIPDSVFSSKILGDGFGIIPTGNEIVCPANGVVKNITNNGFAVNIKTNDGLMLLLHIGINLSKYEGSQVDLLISVGDTVKRGQPICRINTESVVAAGYNPTIAVVITDSDVLEFFKVKTGVVDNVSSPVATYKL